MDIKKVTAVYFSPTGGTKRYVREIAGNISSEFREINITSLWEREKEYRFANDELVIFGAPVYAGRLPLTDIFNKLKGDGTRAVFNVIYGNREFEDALLEEKNMCERNGFVGIAAGAWIAPHTFSDKIASGRPDKSDIACVKQFVEKIKELLNKETLPSLKVPGNNPYRETKSMPFHPKGSRKCTNCKSCVNICPVGAIPVDAPAKTDASKCIDCLACVKVCPQNARGIKNPIFKAAVAQLESKLTAIRKEPEFFIAE